MEYNLKYHYNIDNVCAPNGLETPVKLFSGCLAFSGLFEGVDISFTLCCVLNKNTACLWALGEILFGTGDNGRYALANNLAAVLLANFSSPHLHNQRNV